PDGRAGTRYLAESVWAAKPDFRGLIFSPAVQFGLFFAGQHQDILSPLSDRSPITPAELPRLPSDYLPKALAATSRATPSPRELLVMTTTPSFSCGHPIM